MTILTYGNSSSGGSGLGTPTNYLGSDLSGSPGISRTLDTGSTPNLIVLERDTLQPTKDYTITGTLITFLVYINNTMRLTIWA